VLQLTDQQFGMLAIATTAIAPQKRAAWLEQHAAQLDPPARSGSPRM